MKIKTGETAKAALMVAVMAVCAQLAIPLPTGVAMTLQSFGAALCGYFLGAKKAAIAAAVYVLLGLFGAPVFTALSSASALFGATGGYIIAFIPFCALCGAEVYANSKRLKILLGAAAIAVLHIVGVLWFSYITASPLPTAFLTASLMFLPKDIICVTAAYFVAKRIKKVI